MDQTPNSEFDRLTEHLHEAQRLLSRHRLVENLVNRQEMPRHKLVENLVHRQNLGELGGLLNRLDAVDVARILEVLSPEDRLLAWTQFREDRLDGILLLVLDEVREELVNSSTHQSERVSLNAFELHDGRLRQVKVANKAELAKLKPINILAGIGGMSEFSVMTKDFNIDWPVAYTGFLLGSAVVGWGTYHVLKFFEARAAKRILEDKGPGKHS